MTSCEACAQPGHGPADCANRVLPMCAQHCTCRHGAPEPDPAPYWTAMNRAASSTGGAA